MRPGRQDEALDARAARVDAERSPRVRYGGVIGVMFAFLLLLAFYLTVAGAAHRANLARQQARLEIDRQAACSAFSQAAERLRCAVTLAHHGIGSGSAAVVISAQPPNDLLSATWREHPVVARRPHRTAGLF